MISEAQRRSVTRLIVVGLLTAPVLVCAGVACVDESHASFSANTDAGESDDAANSRLDGGVTDPIEGGDATDTNDGQALGCRYAGDACVDCDCSETYGYRLNRDAGCYSREPTLLLCRTNGHCSDSTSLGCLARRPVEGPIEEYYMPSVPFIPDDDASISGPPIENCQLPITEPGPCD